MAAAYPDPRIDIDLINIYSAPVNAHTGCDQHSPEEAPWVPPSEI